MRETKEFKNNKGNTLVSLMITIVVMVIISSVTLYTSMDRFEINNLEKLYNDLKLLSNKVSNYYLKYNGLPVVRDEKNQILNYTYTELEFEENETGNENSYYILDLEAMSGLTLNYGQEGYEKPNTSDDVFVINEKTHQIYYVKGVESEGVWYHSVLDKASNIEDTIPPTKPEIKIVSGKLNNDKTEYVTEVQIEIVPGKDNWSGVAKTTYSYNFISKNENTGSTIPETVNGNKIIKLQESGMYIFTATTVDGNENKSEIKAEIKVNIPEEIAE